MHTFRASSEGIRFREELRPGKETKGMGKGKTRIGKSIFLIFTVLLLILLSVPQKMMGSTGKACALGDLDRILDYQITADLQEDGSVDFHYDITWKVLDDKKQGPLTWVKIGVPNSDVEYILPETDNIKSASYYSQGGGCYIRIDLKNPVYAEETVRFAFSFTQHNLFTEPTSENKNNLPGIFMDQASLDRARSASDPKEYIGTDYPPEKLYAYIFTPGWFPEIEVEKYTVKWNASKVVLANTPYQEGNYLVWTGSMAKNQKVTMLVEYLPSSFSYTYKDVSHTYTVDKSDVTLMYVILFSFLSMMLILIIIGIAFYKKYLSYNSDAFWSANHTHTHSRLGRGGHGGGGGRFGAHR